MEDMPQSDRENPSTMEAFGERIRTDYTAENTAFYRPLVVFPDLWSTSLHSVELRLSYDCRALVMARHNYSECPNTTTDRFGAVLCF